MSQLGNNPIPTSSNELIRTPSNKPEVISRDAFENISELKALPLELQEQVRAILAKIEQTYSNSVELKNQKDKFLSGIVSNIDPKDLDLSKDLISVELEQWNNKILKTKEIEVVAKKDEVVAKKDEVVAKKDEVVAKKVTKVEKTGEKTFERAKEYDQAFQKLSQKLTTLS